MNENHLLMCSFVHTRKTNKMVITANCRTIEQQLSIIEKLKLSAVCLLYVQIKGYMSKGTLLKGTELKGTYLKSTIIKHHLIHLQYKPVVFY